MTAAAQLAAFVSEWPADAIPTDVKARAKLHLLDTLGCGLAAIGVRAGDHASAVAAAQGGQPEASALGERERLPAALAALANGTRCHALDFDDTHEAGICHVSTVVAPAGLAVGEARAACGAAVLDAYVLGSETALRIAIASARGLYARGFHPTPVCGAFGAAAAAARLMRLDADATTQALGVVGSFAAGLFEYLSDGSATKPLHAGWAAHAGVQAALLAAAGATGPASVLEGRFGLLASHTGDTASAASIAHGLGERWETANVAIKLFPACHFAHASTSAAAELAARHGVAPQDIEKIVVRIPDEGVPLVLEPLAAKHAPRTPYDAKFSLPYMVAHRLIHGHLDLSAFTVESIRDRTVLALAERVDHEPLGERVGSRFAGGARLITRTGESLDEYIAHVPGSPENPLDQASVLAKFSANAELSLASHEATDLVEEVLSLEAATGLEPPLSLLRASAPRGAGTA